MENQHKLIRGHRDLTAEEIDSMNQIKVEGARLDELIEALKAGVPEIDQRWLAIAKTQLQQGMMALVRSVARPQGF